MSYLSGLTGSYTHQSELSVGDKVCIVHQEREAAIQAIHKIVTTLDLKSVLLSARLKNTYLLSLHELGYAFLRIFYLNHQLYLTDIDNAK